MRRPYAIVLLLLACSPQPGAHVPQATATPRSAAPQRPPAVLTAPQASAHAADAGVDAGIADATVTNRGALPPAPTPPAPAKAPWGADSAKLLFAQSVCAAAVKRDRGRVRVGCRGCPPFGARGGHPDGTVAVNPTEFYEIQAVYSGGFTRRGADQALLQFVDCEEPDAGGGGLLLVEKAAGSWHYQPRYYEPMHFSYKCLTFDAEPGALFVCKDGFASGGIVQEYLRLHRFSDHAASWHSHSQLVYTESTAGAGCGYIGSDIPGSEMEAFHKKDLDQDGKEDLEVVVSFAFSPATKRRDERLEAICSRIRPGIDPMPTKEFMPKTTRVRLGFLFDGHTLHATSETKNWIAKLRQHRP